MLSLRLRRRKACVRSGEIPLREREIRRRAQEHERRVWETSLRKCKTSLGKDKCRNSVCPSAQFLWAFHNFFKGF